MHHPARVPGAGDMSADGPPLTIDRSRLGRTTPSRAEDEVVLQMLTLRDQRWSHQAIGQRLGRSRQAISKSLKVVDRDSAAAEL